jgi:nitronate monooxygenase
LDEESAMTPLQLRLGLAHPIVQAPMAGGPSSVALVAAVSAAGGLGSFGSAYEEPETIRRNIGAVRAATDKPFGVNLFLDPGRAPSALELARTQAILRPMRRKFGLNGEAEPQPSIDVSAQFAVVMDERPAVFSSTFGAPDAEMVRDAKARGILVVGTATTVDEAEILIGRDVDAILAQGGEAGGHRGTFASPTEEGLVGVLALTSMIAGLSKVPVIAAGGLMTGGAIRGVIAAGAELAALGTAFLLCPEAGTSAPYRAMLRSERAGRTTLTRAFSGRWARGLPNSFTESTAGVAGELAPFPALNGMTQDLRRAATTAGDGEYISLWAGQGARLIRELPAATLMATLATELAMA